MSEKPNTGELLDLTTEIVAAHVGNNTVALADLPALARYPWLPAVRGDLLARLGRHDEARAAFARAADLTENGPERALMQTRARAGGATPA